MNLKRIKDSENVIEVGNENSYAKCLNSLNYLEQLQIQTDDFEILESEFDKGTRLSYKVTDKPNEDAVLVLKLNRNSFINIFNN